MPLPLPVHAKIGERFEALVREAEDLQRRMGQEESQQHQHAARGGVTILAELEVMEAEFLALKTKALDLLEFVGSGNGALAAHSKCIRAFESKPSHARELLGTLMGLADDYRNGFLDSILRQAEAEVAADYLGQAERLLDDGQPGKHDHVPGAVLLGAVLEKSLRTLCLRQSPPVVLDTPNEPKMMSALIDDLKKAHVFNELKAKQLRAWADIRNAAAHGEFTRFSRSDVETMKIGIAAFLAEFM